MCPLIKIYANSLTTVRQGDIKSGIMSKRVASIEVRFPLLKFGRNCKIWSKL